MKWQSHYKLTHTSGGIGVQTPGHDIQPNNFDILSVEL